MRSSFTQRHPIQNLEIAIIFIVFGEIWNYVFEEDILASIGLRARIVSYVPEANKVFIERVVVYTLEGTHWIGNLNQMALTWGI